MHLVQSFWKEVRVICACINTISLVPKLKKTSIFHVLYPARNIDF